MHQVAPSVISYGTGPKGHASISDRNGNLLFYLDRDTIRDNNGDSIVGGLSTNGLGTSICPIPCNDSLYLVFKYDILLQNIRGITFQIVNMNGNGGLGSISQQRTLLDTTFKADAFDLSITRHANNRDYWLVHRHMTDTTSYMYAWQISDTGIAANPVISLQEYFNAVILRSLSDFSPIGNYYAETYLTYGQGSNNVSYTRLLTFDNATGQFQLVGTFNEANLSHPDNNYSVAFSPDGSMLYCVSQFRAIWQFDLSSGNPNTILNSGQDIVAYNNFWPYGLNSLRLGIDGKIYVSRGGNNINAPTYLGVINNPNDTGSACNFVLNGLQCNQQTWVVLPSIIHNLYVKRTIQRDSLECTDDTTTFSFDNYSYFDSAQWYIDTGATQVLVSSDSLAHYVFDSAGVYPIMAVSYSGCRLDTFYDTVTVLLTPAPDLGPDTILCEGDTIQISNEWQYSYLWNTGDTTELIQIMVPDTYWLQLSNYCGSAVDSVVVDSIIKALVIFPTDDTLMCDGDVLHLSAEVDAGTYTWFDGSTDSVNDITAADTVWATAENACGISSDTIRVRFTDVPELPNLDNVICLGDTLTIELETDSLSTFLWYNGDTTSFDSIWVASSNYWVVETNICGADTDTFRLATVTDPVAFIGNDTGMCVSDSVVLDASTPFGSYVWQDATTDSIFGVGSTLLVPGSNYFHVTVTNACGTDRDTILIEADLALQIHLGKDDTACVDDTLLFSVPEFQRATYQWSIAGAYFSFDSEDLDSFDIPAKTRKTTGYGSSQVIVALTNSCGTFSDSMLVAIDAPFRPKLPNKGEYCHGDSILLDAGASPRTTYRWRLNGLNYDSLSTILNAHDVKTVARHPMLGEASDHAFSVFTENACGTGTDTVQISIDSLPRSSNFDTVHFCRDESTLVVLDKSTIDEVLWSDGSELFTRELSEEASYLLTYINHCGETKDTIRTVRVERPNFRYESPLLLCEDDMLIEPSYYDPKNDDYYPVYFLWNTEHQLPWMTISEIGTYSVVATNSAGCQDSATVVVKTCGPDFYTANSFTPNDDPFNPYWKPVGEGLFEFTCTIYDRWGQAIFTFDHNHQGWDGTINNQPAPIGVYHWKMDVISEDFNGQNTFEGRLMLVKQRIVQCSIHNIQFSMITQHVSLSFRTKRNVRRQNAVSVD